MLSLVFFLSATVFAEQPEVKEAFKEPKRVPFVISVPEKAKQTASQQNLELMELLAQVASSQLTYFQEYPFVLPATAFVDSVFNDGLIQSSDLQEFPESKGEKELYDLAFDKEGKRYSLSKEQRKEIRKNGTFSVQSEAFPKEYHRWELSDGLQNPVSVESFLKKYDRNGCHRSE